MSWKLGSPVRIATPKGSVFVAPSVHHHSSIKRHGLFTVGKNGKNIMPFIVTDEFLDDPDVGDKLENIAVQLEYMI